MVVFVECVWRPGVPVGAPTLYLLVCFLLLFSVCLVLKTGFLELRT